MWTHAFLDASERRDGRISFEIKYERKRRAKEESHTEEGTGLEEVPMWTSQPYQAKVVHEMQEAAVLAGR